MRNGTLFLFYFVKYLELTFLFIGTSITIGSGLWLVQRILNSIDISSTEMQLLVLIPICLLIILFNLFYNNLLINIRFFCKM